MMDGGGRRVVSRVAIGGVSRNTERDEWVRKEGSQTEGGGKTTSGGFSAARETGERESRGGWVL